VIFQSSKSNRQSPWKLLLALLCIALVFVCGTVQAVHVHPDGDISHADCPLCAIAHVSVQIGGQSASLHFTPVVSTVEAFLALARSRTFSIFALFTRPPPADVVSV
jgi:hypothetical protein